MSEATNENTPLLDGVFLRKLERLAVAARKVQRGVNKGERKSKRRGASIEFADFRNYVQGDDLRHLDWNIYGRLDELYLKIFHEQEDLTLSLLLDMSKSMDFGNPNKMTYARQLAAAIGYIALAGHDRVQVQAFSGEGTRVQTGLRGKVSTRKFFAFLQDVEAGGSTTLAEGCKRFTTGRPARGVSVLMSDLLDEQGFEEPLRRLQQAGTDGYVIHILSPQEIDPPVTGDLKLLDAETDAFVEISTSRSLIKRYKENLAGFCEAVRTECLKRGLVYVPASTEVPMERLTLDVLRRGGMLR